MQYRKFGQTDEKVSALGFGAMRLPVIDKDQGKIDEEKAIAMIRYAIDHGVNYLDTAWPYHNGSSESLCAKVMADGYRNKVKIATKMPTWEIKEAADYQPIFEKQISNLQVEQIDFYLMHALCSTYWETMQQTDYKSFLRAIKAGGQAKYLGFSFHDDLDLFKEIVDDFEWDFVQIQLNYIDGTYQAGLEGMKYAAAKGLGVVVMEPLRGGMLAKTELPKALSDIWASGSVKQSPAAWAFSYLYDMPEVSLVLSGMSTMEQVIENVETASQAKPGMLDEIGHKQIEKAKAFFIDRMVVPCTSCNYCMPCPFGVKIPEVFWALNHASQFEDEGKAKFWINGWLNEDERPSKCVNCGACVPKCPQHIAIPKELKIASEKYEVIDK